MNSKLIRPTDRDLMIFDKIVVLINYFVAKFDPRDIGEKWKPNNRYKFKLPNGMEATIQRAHKGWRASYSIYKLNGNIMARMILEEKYKIPTKSFNSTDLKKNFIPVVLRNNTSIPLSDIFMNQVPERLFNHILTVRSEFEAVCQKTHPAIELEFSSFSISLIELNLDIISAEGEELTKNDSFRKKLAAEVLIDHTHSEYCSHEGNSFVPNNMGLKTHDRLYDEAGIDKFTGNYAKGGRLKSYLKEKKTGYLNRLELSLPTAKIIRKYTKTNSFTSLLEMIAFIEKLYDSFFKEMHRVLGTNYEVDSSDIRVRAEEVISKFFPKHTSKIIKCLLDYPGYLSLGVDFASAYTIYKAKRQKVLIKPAGKGKKYLFNFDYIKNVNDDVGS